VGGSRSTDESGARRIDYSESKGGKERDIERLNVDRPYESGNYGKNEREREREREMCKKFRMSRRASDRAGRTGARNTFEHTVNARRTPTD